MERKKYTIGMDFGSLSCRAILVDSEDGTIVAERESVYAHGVMTETLPDGTRLPPMWVLQDPRDYESCIYSLLPGLLQDSGIDKEQVATVGVDATASTVLCLDEKLRPMCCNDRFSWRIHAWPKMWKHHADAKEAADITERARLAGGEYIESCGGTVGAEFMLPKLLQCFREDRALFDSSYTFMELGDWITSLLTGHKCRSASMLAGKMLWDASRGYPSKSFLNGVEPGFGDALYEKQDREDTRIAYPGECVGLLCAQAAKQTGLPEGIPVSASQMDGYAGLPGCGVYRSGRLMLVLGTSSGYMLLDDMNRTIPGLCASIPNSMMKGYMCHAAGQSSGGDMLGWYMENMLPGSYERKARDAGMDLHSYLSLLASGHSAAQSRLIALDWFNGNKTPLNNFRLSGLIVGLDMSTRPEEIYRALIEASAFGAKVIIDLIKNSGTSINSVVVSGGISRKNPFLMQVYADVLGCPLEVCGSAQAAAQGSAVYAAAAGGLYPDVPSAVIAMGGKPEKTYMPRQEETLAYAALFEEYKRLYDYFGRGENPVMERLKEKAEAII